MDADFVLAASDAGSGDVAVLAARLAALGAQAEVSGSAGRAEVRLDDVVGVDEVLAAMLPRRWLTFRAVDDRGEIVPWCSDDGRCQDLGLLEPFLTSADVDDARVTTSVHDGGPIVAVTFMPDGGRRFGEVTAELVGRQMAILVGRDVLSVPVVLEPIPGGTAWLMVDRGMGHDRALREAGAIVAILGAPPLEGSWTLHSRR